MTESFKDGYDEACPKCRFLEEACAKHRPLIDDLTGPPDLVEEVGHILGFDVQFPETEHPADGYSISREGKPDYLRTVSIEFTSMEVDPELLSILIGQTKPDFAIEIHTPVKRTFWQWLRRKPPLWNHWYVPNAKMGEVDDQADD